jgi:hypothetical protein
LEKFEKITVYKGVKIWAVQESDSIHVYFEDPSGVGTDFLHGAKPLEGYTSFDDAIAAGEVEVNLHEREHVGDVGHYTVFIQLRWNGDWSYVLTDELGVVEKQRVNGKRARAKRVGLQKAKERIEAADE